MRPTKEYPPKYGQLHIWDTSNVIDNRMDMARSDKLDRTVVAKLQKVLDRDNPWFKVFKTAKEIVDEAVLNDEPVQDIYIQLKGEQNTKLHPGRYNKPTTSEIAAVLPSNEFDETDYEVTQDLIVTTREDRFSLPYDSVGHQKTIGHLQHISIGSPLYEPLHYTLMYPFGTHGWSFGMPSFGKKMKKKTDKNDTDIPMHLTILRYSAFRLTCRDTECGVQVPNNFGLLSSEWIVTMALRQISNNANWIRTGALFIMIIVIVMTTNE